MSEKNRKLVAGALSHILADTYNIYLRTQNFHWNLVGPEFYFLHILFEKQYEELADAVDEIAERVRALGYYVDATFSGFQKMTSLKEMDKQASKMSIKDMLKNLLDGHEQVIRSFRKLSDLGEKQKDPATVDLIGRRMNVHEKFAWMLRSHLA